MSRLKAQSGSTHLIVAMLVIAAVAIVFWVMLLSPKREEASKLETNIDAVESELSQHQAEVVEGERAREEFPVAYQRLVVLGKAVPANDDIASLLVQVNRLSRGAGSSFRNLTLSSSGAAASEATSSPAASPTEAEASLLPLGAEIGPAGLGVMAYEVELDGNFFEIADFLEGLDALVKTKEGNVTVNGRLLTINSFSLEGDQERGFPALEGSLSLTSYLTPPEQGLTGGATPSAPPSESATPASATIGETP
jgi:Tfp pilus assembly protein PilO